MDGVDVSLLDGGKWPNAEQRTAAITLSRSRVGHFFSLEFIYGCKLTGKMCQC